MPTVVRGLAEAAVLLVVAAALAFAAAGAWTLVGSGDFLSRLGMCVIAAGVFVALFGTGYARRAEMVEWHAFSGTKFDSSGGPEVGTVLTNPGAAIFVALPLVVIGAFLLQ